MDRRHLEYFLAVVETGSFTRAAGRLTIAQPSLSHTVRALERELGTPLFDRGGRGVRLTAAGEALVGPARRTLRSFALAAGAARGAVDAGAGRLTVATNTLWAMEPLPRMVGAFRRVRPAVQVVISDPAGRRDVVAALAAGEVDLGLVAGDPPGGRLEGAWVGDQELVAVVPRGVRGLASPLPPERLVEHGLVTTPRGTALRDYVDDLLAGAGLPTDAAVETPHLAAVVPLVAAGAGLAVLPTGLASQDAPVGVERLGLQGAPRTPVHLAWRRDLVDETARHFLDVALATLTGVAGDEPGLDLR